MTQSGQTGRIFVGQVGTHQAGTGHVDSGQVGTDQAGTANRAEAASFANQHGLVTSDSDGDD